MCNCSGKKKLQPVQIPVNSSPQGEVIPQQVTQSHPPPQNLRPVINKRSMYRHDNR